MRPSLLLIASFALVTAACGEKKEEAKPAVAAAPAAPTGVETPCATCKVIKVTMTSNDKGNFFEPSKFEAHEGDVIRFTVAVGVHNANFLPDSNTIRTGLPPASPLLQLAGQTWDVKLTFGKGTFYFQCDPHAALGMKGHVKVE